MRLLFQLCSEIGLDRDDRLELAEILLQRDVPTFTDLTDDEVGRLLDAVRGWQYVQHLRNP
jgi:hypothetical protein